MRTPSTSLLLVIALTTPVAAQSPINFGKLQASRDSFVVLVQGQPRGYEVISLQKTGAGFTLQDDTNLMPMMQQHTEVTISSQGAMQQVSQKGTAGGQATSIDVKYAGGKASGMAMSPGPDGAIKHVMVGSDVPAGAVDDNSVLPLLTAVEWKPGLTFTLPVFASGMNQLHSATFTVLGTEKVTVPAGTFDAYKVSITGLTAPMTVYVNTAEPHRVLKATPEGVPIEIVAAN